MLQALVSKGKSAAYKIKHANILLMVDANGSNWTDEQTAEALSCHPNTVARIRRRFVEEGLEAALERKKREYVPRVVDGEVAARLIALRYSEPPAGHARWTLRLLADKAVEREIVPAISHETVRQVLKKRSQAPLKGVFRHSTGTGCSLCGSYGRHPGTLSTTLRCRISGYLHG